ncbi:MAG: DUF11 domain-containing protein [Chloroflexi bacterium]|nr:DUF11 domain-containing protein [Chloroflexota bacterium]
MYTRATTRTRLSVIPVLIALIFNLAMAVPIASAPAGQALALAGTSFDATDGNLTVEPPETDWCTPAPNRVVGPDSPSGSNDTSFVSSPNKEDTDGPTLGNGTIPNNKDDLLREYIASETVNGDLFVYLAWVRADSTGTSTIDFEFNQSNELSVNGVTKKRTDGDLLVTFDFQANPGSAGGYNVDLTVRTWSAAAVDQPDPTSSPPNRGAWINPVDVKASGLADGSVNFFGTSRDPIAINDCVSGGTLDNGEFGEAALNLTDIIGGACRAFGSVFTKSRSSNSFSADLKDRIDPVPVNFSTCGQLTILKQDENQQALGGATFSITPNPFTLTGSLSVTDNAAPDDNAAAGTIHLSDVEPGTYSVCETAAPAGYIIDTVCQELTIAANGSATFGPFTNGLGDISWAKLDDQSGNPICCATFSLTGIAGAAIGFSRTVTDNGTNDEDADAGELLVTGLLLGTYRITETVAPVGYDLPATAFQDVVLAGETASAANPFRDPPQADASITKTAVLDPVIAGQPASFTVVVNAGGTGDSEDVVLSDLNATGRAWTVSGTDSADCDSLAVAAGDTLRCDFGTLANGASRSVTITMATSADDCADGIANTATVASSNDHDASNNEASDSITVLCPNPGIVKEAVADPIVFGEDAVFTITVNALGTGPAENVVLSDLNDTGHLWTVSGTDAAACDSASVADGDTLTCTWDSIPAGGSRTITITLTSGASDCELGIENSASITADADVDTSNNTDGDTVSVLCPDPSVLKSADADPITAGDEAGFDIVVAASGTGSSENVILSDLNQTAHTWNVSGADASACSDLSVAPGETLSCDFGSIPSGQDRTIAITMTSNAGDCAAGIENTATITADADVDPSNNTSSASIEVLCPDLELVKDGSDVVSAGDTVQFTLSVANRGDGAARNVTLTDQLPGLGLGTWIVTDATNIADTDCGIVADVLTCSIDELAAGASFSVTVSSITTPGACPSVSNDATVVAGNEPEDDEYENEDSHTITVNCPDVTIDKEPVETPISAGETAQFTIKVWNLGPGVAYDVEVHDILPAGTIWQLLDADGMECSTDLVPGQQTLTCTLDELAPGADNARTLLIGYSTTQDDCGLLDNEAEVEADNEPGQHAGNNQDAASIVVECPGLNMVKSADADPIDAGEEASFTITVWNAGPGDAFDVALHDTLPAGPAWDLEVLQGDAECSIASSLSNEGVEQRSIDCDLGTLTPSEMEEGVIVRVFARTDRTDCGLLDNTAYADASNNDQISSRDTVVVRCPTISLVKVNDAAGPVLPGTSVTYTLSLTVSDGPAEDVEVVDLLPAGLEAPTGISHGGTFDDAGGTITWSLGELADGEYVLEYVAIVADDVANGAELVNVASATSPNSQCPDAETLGPECEDDSTVVVRVPTLVIDKEADVEVITISGEADALVATPSVVTWTLTYTLTDGPVTNAVISDELPTGLAFLDAADGGTFADGTVTWTFPSLETSGSVTFRTTVDPRTISRVAPTVNVAVIDSDETEPDDGEDDVRVEVEAPPLGGTPTPRPSLPDTATGVGMNGEPVTVPVELLAALFLGSLGALALANVRARDRRR